MSEWTLFLFFQCSIQNIVCNVSIFTDLKEYFSQILLNQSIKPSQGRSGHTLTDYSDYAPISHIIFHSQIKYVYIEDLMSL